MEELAALRRAQAERWRAQREAGGGGATAGGVSGSAVAVTDAAPTTHKRKSVPKRKSKATERAVGVHTLAGVQKASGGGSGAGSAKKRRAMGSAHAGERAPRVTGRSVDAHVASLFEDGSGSATENMQSEGDAHNRLEAVMAGKLISLEELSTNTKTPQLLARYRGLQKELEERVQFLSADEVRAIIRGARARGSSRSRRATAGAAALRPRSAARRAPAFFWSAVKWFGSVEAAVRQVEAEAGAEGDGCAGAQTRQ